MIRDAPCPMAASHRSGPVGADDAAHSTGLLAMPREIIDLIAQGLGTCSDVVACMSASSVFDAAHLFDLLVRSHGSRLGRVVESGAPLAIVQGLFARRRLEPAVDGVLCAAAKAGRLDVLQWMCESIAQAQRLCGSKRPGRSRTRAGGSRSVTGSPSGLCRLPDAHDDFVSVVEFSNTDQWPPLPIALSDAEIAAEIAAMDLGQWPDDTDASPPASPDLGCDTDDEIAMPWPDSSRPVSPVSAIGQMSGLGPRPRVTHYKQLSRKDPLSILSDSVYEACLGGHIDVVRYLVDACPLNGTGAWLLPPGGIVGAARRGHQSVVAFAHERRLCQRPTAVDSAHPCNCASSIARAAIDARQYGVLRWMHAAGCRSFESTGDALVWALGVRDTDAVDALTRTLDPRAVCVSPDGQFIRDMRSRALARGQSTQDVAVATAMWTANASFAIGVSAAEAAANPSVVVPIALVLSRGFTMADAHHAFAAAASAGNLPLLKWAAGDAIDYRGERLVAPQGLPWNHTSTVLKAASKDRLDVVQWLSRDPHCHRCLGPILARSLLASNGMGDVLRWMHHSGLAPVHTWDALYVAVLHGQLVTVKEVADLGGTYTASVLVEAVRRGDARTVAFLCTRYGTGDAQAALDAWVVDPNRRGGVDWIVRHVPGLNIADVACVLGMIDDYGDPLGLKETYRRV